MISKQAALASCDLLAQATEAVQATRSDHDKIKLALNNLKQFVLAIPDNEESPDGEDTREAAE